MAKNYNNKSYHWVNAMEDNKQINRRDALKASGSAIALGSIGGVATRPVRAVARDPQNLGERTFAQVSLRHEQAPTERIDHTDDFPTYQLDREDSDLTLTRFSTDSTVETFETNDSVVEADGFHSAPTTVYDAQNDWLPIDELRTLQLADTYAFPAVRAAFDSNDQLVVSSEGDEMTLDTGSTRRLELSERTVQVRRQSDEFEEIPDPKSGGTVQVREQGPVETTTVRPVVVARNHGPITVRDGSEVTR